MNLKKIIFCFGLFFLPFIFWPWVKIPYEIPRVWFFQRWVEILAILGIWEILRSRGNLVKKEINLKLIIGVVAFFVVALISSIFGVDFLKSLQGNYYRSDGLMTLVHLLGLFFFLIIFWEKSWEKLMIKIFALSSILLGFWTVFLGLKYSILSNWGDLGSWGGAVFGKAIGATFGQPNFLAGYLLITLPFTAYFLKEKGRGRLLGLIGLIGQIGGIFFSGARAGIVGVFLFFGGWLILKISKEKRWGKIILLSGTIVMILLTLLYSFYPRKGVFVREKIEEKTRERIGVKGINAFLKKPVFGWGVANFDYAFEASVWPLKINNDVYVDKAHSNLFEILVTQGILGFGIYIWLIFLTLKELLKENKGDKGNKEEEKDIEVMEIILLVFLLFLFHSQTNIISISEEIFFWLILGMAAGQTKIVKRAQE